MRKPRYIEDPTVKHDREFLLRAAREADARAREAEARGAESEHARSTARPPEYSEIEVMVDAVDEVAGVDALLEADADGSHDDTVQMLQHDAAAGGETKPGQSSIPYLLVGREDVPWFGLDATSEGVVAAIDGRSSVEALAQHLRLPRDLTLAVLRDLASRGVVAFR